MPVSLKEIVSEWVMTSDMVRLFLNKQTGKLYTVSEHDDFDFDDDDDTEDEISEWQRQHRDQLREIEGSDDWILMPAKVTHEEYRIMERFCLSQDEKLVELLMTAISGKGAFRRFKDVIYRHGLSNAWHAYHDAWATEEIKNWLEVSGIAYEA